MQRLPLERADDERAGEALADARRLRQVEVTTTSLGNGLQSFDLVVVRLPELLLRQAAGVMDPAQDDQGADLEASREAIDLGAQFGLRLIFLTNDSERYEQLGGDLVAPALDLMFRQPRRLRVGHGG